MCGGGEPILNLDLILPSQTRYLGLVGDIADEVAREANSAVSDRETLAYHLNLAVTEAVANAIRHGSRGDPTKIVRIRVCLDNKDINVQIFDHGPGFELKAGPLLAPMGLDEHGRGLFLIRSVMDQVEYRRADGGNVLEMRKSLAQSPSVAA